MSGLRKLRAVLLLATVSAVFWGIAAVLGRVGLALVTGNPPLYFFTIPWLLTRMFLPFGAIGFFGGAIYATAIALAPVKDEETGLSAARAALFGAFGGVVVFLLFRFVVLAGVPLATGIMSTLIVPTTVIGLLGAG